jgi:hypothetical protein
MTIASPSQTKKGPTPFSSYRPFAFLSMANVQWSWCHCPIVDADVINQAGEEVGLFPA